MWYLEGGKIVALALRLLLRSLQPQQQSLLQQQWGGELNIAIDLEEDRGRWHCSSAQMMPKRDQLGGFHGMEGQGGSGNDE
jgi:hypothetical protein